MPKSNWNIIILFATGFGLGWSPVASGTLGTLLGFLIVVFLVPLALVWQILIVIGLALFAVPVCEIGENYFGNNRSLWFWF